MANSATIKFAHTFTKENPGNIEDFLRIDRKKLIGSGSYGQVTKAVDKRTNAERAVKSIDLSKVKDKGRFEAEISIQQSLDHPGIVKLYEVFKDAKRVYLVMELCTGGELFDRIIEEVEKHEGSAFDEGRASKMMQQILCAINYCHTKGFAHRDIKPENFLLQNKDRDAPIKIIDFGLAARFTAGRREMRTKAGTPYYVAPEVLNSSVEPYNEMCDIWSLGVLTYIILCGYPPFYGDKDAEILKRVKAGTYEYCSPDWDNISAAAKDFIDKALVKNVDKRWKADALLTHPWITENSMAPTGRLPLTMAHGLKTFHMSTKLKKVALTLIAQQLREEEIMRLKESFETLDANRDGTLTIKEVKDGMLAHGCHIPADIDETLANLDTDGSGTIDYTEFIAASLTTQQYMKKEIAWAAFRTFDTDGSGAISKDELKAALKDLPDEQITLMIKEVDLNGDGMIDFDEFVKMLELQ